MRPTDCPDCRTREGEPAQLCKPHVAAHYHAQAVRAAARGMDR